MLTWLIYYFLDLPCCFVYCFRFDFFIVSQSVRQGTVSPTHYNVIHDDMRWPAERVHKLTYWLTHLYYNWPVCCKISIPNNININNNKNNGDDDDDDEKHLFK